ncbi:MAG TPA: beta-propeller fold lactonase family protein, partial [Puia sp.]
MKNLDFILSASLTLMSGMVTAQRPEKTSGIMYAGTSPGRGSKGIYVLQFDPEQKKFTELQTVTEKKNPNFLAVSPDK